tara:strand:- start:848 stop:1051 length:204 start_codon:yes stop_codon:yes gene_type:complete
MEEDKKHIVIQEKKMLLIHDDDEYNSIILTEKNERFIILDIKSNFPKQTSVIYYLIQKEDKLDINLN